MRQVWIGLISVADLPGSDTLGGALGAFVNALAVCESEIEFITQVRQAAAELGLQISAVEDIEPLRARLMRTSIKDELAALAREVQETGELLFGTFHAFADRDSEHDS